MIDPIKAVEWSRMGTRKVYGEILTELAPKYPELMVLVADVAASSGLEEFRKKYPKQFLNVGIAEQNMIGVAAGLAKNGQKVFVTSFAPFVSMRSYEWIRSYIAYMELDVTIVGIGSGVGLGSVGNTHYGREDLALMQAIPGMSVFSPADGSETAKMVAFLLEYHKPSYLRLTGVEGIPVVYREEYSFQMGKAILQKEGKEVAILATGTMVYEALRTAKVLERQGVSTAVYDVHTIKPIDRELIHRLVEQNMLLVTMEEHSVEGGLGSIVASCNVKEAHPVPQIMFGLPDCFTKAGSYRYVLEQSGLEARKMAERILEERKRL